MARSGAPNLPKVLQLLHTTILVPAQMQHDILQRTGMSIAQHKSIPVPPLRTRRAMIPSSAAGGGGRPEEMGHGSATHRSAGMPRVGLLHHVGGEGADGVDAFELKRGALVGFQLDRLMVYMGAFGGGFRIHFLFALKSFHGVYHSGQNGKKVPVSMLIRRRLIARIARLLQIKIMWRRRMNMIDGFDMEVFTRHWIQWIGTSMTPGARGKVSN
mmetsp:Transcript_10509/g.22797  ORF Transcript_10509/g.22797 Transcript_10509/m.22797 type:complete len:214 (-) Transcript_10509:41-682(-)